MSIPSSLLVSCLESHYGTNRLALVHEIESVIDPVERHHVRDEVVDVDLLVHVPVDDPGHVGAAARAAERRAFPHAARHELERSRLDFLAGAGDTDDHRHAPAAMAALERLAHEIDVADALEAVVRATVGERDEIRHE